MNQARFVIDNKCTVDQSTAIEHAFVDAECMAHKAIQRLKKTRERATQSTYTALFGTYPLELVKSTRTPPPPDLRTQALSQTSHTH
ncbi:MAG: hypothetical protein M1829_003726 [Trizodia sp. TS-e1964]|nr:MAG: hypothetical protein M1829_003726 [Trizodia sp. TS-e1964]